MVNHRYKQQHLEACSYWSWQSVILGQMGTRKCQLVTVDGAEQRFLGSVWFYRSMHGCGSYQNSVEPLWHCPLSAPLSTGTFPDVWVKPQPETELKVSEVRCLHHRLFGWRNYLRWLKNKTKKKTATCMVVLIANGSWLRGAFKMLIRAMETKTFCASRTFLLSSIT